jgi:hypothetical protein
MSHKRLTVGLGFVAFAVTFAATYSKAISLPYLSHDTQSADASVAVPVGGSGPELVLVYIGAAACGPSNAPQLPGIVAKIREAVGQQAHRSGVGFRTIGIAKDPDARTGLGHLNKYGRFDEIAAGGGWLNTGALRYIFTDLPGVGATPQIAVVLRTVQRDGGAVGVRDERILLRKVGLSELTEWSSRGGDLPGDFGVVTQ